METKILETFPFWPGYILLVVFASGLVTCLWVCGILILSAFRVPRPPVRRDYIAMVFLTPFATGSFWVIFSMMFLRFHAVVIAPEHIELVYCWPRSHLAIEASALRGADVIHYRKGGHLKIITDQRVFKSVGFKQFAVADEIRDVVEARVKR
jgi:hypothetical protein